MESKFKQIDQITRDFVAAFSQLTYQEINWKPDPGKWSIAQNIDHLIVINSSYFPIIQAAHDKTLQLAFLSKISFIPRKMGNLLLKAISPENKTKSRTFPIWEPDFSDLPVDILKKFFEHQEELKKVIDKSTDLIQKNQVIHSPASPYIVYYLQTAFDIIIAHEHRHLEQAKSVLNMIKAN
jgi:hypothetical protein